MDPAGMILAIESTRAHLRSALPNAPVAREPAPRAPRAAPVRRTAAGALRRLAAAVEPAVS